VISSSQRPLPDNTQHSQQRDIHAPGGIITHNFNKQAAADLSLRPRGYWDRQYATLSNINIRLRLPRNMTCCHRVGCFIALQIRNLGARWRWVINATPRSLYPYNPPELISQAHVLMPGNISVLSGGTVIL